MVFRERKNVCGLKTSIKILKKAVFYGSALNFETGHQGNQGNQSKAKQVYSILFRDSAMSIRIILPRIKRSTISENSKTIKSEYR